MSNYVDQSLETWNRVVSKYYIEDALVEPTLAISMTDNWIQFNLRYIVDYKKRRFTKHLLNEKIGKAIEMSNWKVHLASVTLEIVKIPNINMENDKKPTPSA